MQSAKILIVLGVLLGVAYSKSVLRGQDKDCPQFCATIYSPVCASDDKEVRTFGNSCELEAFNCNESRDLKVLRKGECTQDSSEAENKAFQPEKDCPMCTKIYLPVCGVDGEEERAFPNECAMDSFNCFETRNFRMLRDGIC